MFTLGQEQVARLGLNTNETIDFLTPAARIDAPSAEESRFSGSPGPAARRQEDDREN
ncbi:hypothetical protein ACIP1U_06570 [Cupriavidus sp. NPDC089707]|uniref:hypothetical protein n=1 Tax=Cupriavidus sp. NPDC089707 TaxID=3363963 RepID=UPI0038067F92